ncbi:cob(I)yrinic acid a,c-diamide adenosyltransferase [Alteromonas pelagimontana]|uniref:Corrinoid adenosyltransferase n=1 Tax=Alteromonas pelagimontana TaxID=1858656 RepID=A0A6M4MA02_9ALTE|nr:cob(I)yrinic acid a,c-diamide adenosyltransferase [Alteromonas pelagimontana]QJR79510.1 cob(I)yrinic acid a,c-diamide adenosyltransferase [Alteromonas pelagimontana]
MKVYTRGGDKGNTQIYVDKAVRVTKDDAVLQCYGDIDELNSHVGLLACQVPEHRDRLTAIQKNLFQVGFAISATSTLTIDDITDIEQEIDRLTESLAAQTSFILPGGCIEASQSHICRAVCRRAERTLVKVSHEHDVADSTLAYLNRLSDYFFTLARYLNHPRGEADIKI